MIRYVGTDFMMAFQQREAQESVSATNTPIEPK